MSSASSASTPVDSDESDGFPDTEPDDESKQDILPAARSIMCQSSDGRQIRLRVADSQMLSDMAEHCIGGDMQVPFAAKDINIVAKLLDAAYDAEGFLGSHSFRELMTLIAVCKFLDIMEIQYIVADHSARRFRGASARGLASELGFNAEKLFDASVWAMTTQDEPLFTPPDETDAMEAAVPVALDTNDDSLQLVLERMDAPTLQTVKKLGPPWRSRARMLLGNPKSAWRLCPVWSDLATDASVTSALAVIASHDVADRTADAQSATLRALQSLLDILLDELRNSEVAMRLKHYQLRAHLSHLLDLLDVPPHEEIILDQAANQEIILGMNGLQNELAGLLGTRFHNNDLGTLAMRLVAMMEPIALVDDLDALFATVMMPITTPITHRAANHALPFRLAELPPAAAVRVFIRTVRACIDTHGGVRDFPAIAFEVIRKVLRDGRCFPVDNSAGVGVLALADPQVRGLIEAVNR